MNYVDEIVNLLDKNLKYIKHEITKDTIYIYVVSNKKRLEKEIARVGERMSLIEASKYLRKNTANVGKSTVSNILKKRKSKNSRNQ